ncbi:DUF829 domain protein (PaxU), putative [Talaromyces stipitatus ATCC 10500]|uniref:DUF829 domain protein (PaxU), putative n=1 Tax=Talaromyces stipitatus (strain ATCC 10500 / CBS 375.48 / QM 6759 / NRRL 1006) TaxID=441959 RepID=B8M4W1_TALSN|nr:DUF829 domain protein (PaxU), putative [Talaromyces stipitatus ATCC 10500]EED19396.1 DUF829 domain protein (PaxU), putative [Talaromyces stipitatus ATCC 10500]
MPNAMHVQILSPRSSLFIPESPDPDQLVIVCSWTDAQQKHIARYLQLHKLVTPRAKILLIQTTAVTLFKPYAWQRASLKPAAQYIIENAVADSQKRDSSPGREPNQHEHCRNRRSRTKILLHSLSNGGSLTATQLLILLREVTHAPLPLIGVIMDSSPDSGSYKQSHNAMVRTQPPSKPRRAAVSLLAHAALIPIWASYIIGARENSQLEMRRIILDRHYVDTLNIRYVYSKSDKITDWRDVLVHAEEARGKGWLVEEYKLVESAHCSHIRSNPEILCHDLKIIHDARRLLKFNVPAHLA